MELNINELDTIVHEILDDILSSSDKVGNGWEIEMYADYRDTVDEIDKRTLKDIFNSDRPDEYFYDMLWEWYDKSDDFSYLVEQVMTKLDSRDIEYDSFDVWEIVQDYVSFYPPYDHFINQDIETDIIVDTGDGNYDYTLNSRIAPCYDAYGETEINDEASLVWLVQQQGHSPDELYFEEQDGGKFINSVYNELAEHSSNIAQLTFLVSMKFGDVLRINQTIKEGGSGSITLDKSVMCGLFDNYNGGGSHLDIQLEKDVTIPFNIISQIVPDGAGYGYSVDSVYGLVGSAWGDDVKSINY